jgi:hypothetical protein
MTPHPPPSEPVDETLKAAASFAVVLLRVLAMTTLAALLLIVWLVW